LPGCIAINRAFTLNSWVESSEMSEEEKATHPEHTVTGGYLKSLSYKEAWAKAWEQFTDEDIEDVKAIPNFNPDVFLEITGIDVRKEK
jgi:ubiquinone biosynthesis protein Coq4